MNSNIGSRIENLDISLFSAIESQISNSERKALLLLQRCIRNRGYYTYLEVGSYKGGTLQPFYADPKCKHIYSVDKRPAISPDERGRDFNYYNFISSDQMMENLNNAFPNVFSQRNKIENFETDISEIEKVKFKNKPNLCFIDGEHTNKAVYNDFLSCLSIGHTDLIIAMHDANIIYNGISRIILFLHRNKINYKTLKLMGDVYIIMMNKAIDHYNGLLTPYSENQNQYFLKAKYYLNKEKLYSKWPKVYLGVRRIKNIF